MPPTPGAAGGGAALDTRLQPYWSGDVMVRKINSVPPLGDVGPARPARPGRWVFRSWKESWWSSRSPALLLAMLMPAVPGSPGGGPAHAMRQQYAATREWQPTIFIRRRAVFRPPDKANNSSQHWGHFARFSRSSIKMTLFKSIDFTKTIDDPRPTRGSAGPRFRSSAARRTPTA